MGKGVGEPWGLLSLGGANDGDGLGSSVKTFVGSTLGDMLDAGDCVGPTDGPTGATDLVGFGLLVDGFAVGCTDITGGRALTVTTGVAAGVGAGDKTTYTAGHSPFRLIIAKRIMRPIVCCHSQ